MRAFAAFLTLAVSGSVATYLSGCGGCAADDPNVLTQHNNSARWGQTLAEKTLKPSNVGFLTFGKLYDRNVNGALYAQPLYVHGVATAASGKRNVLYVATETNWVYAFDADELNADPNAGLLFSRQLRATGASTVCGETPSGVVGITATPVIDASSSTMYVIARDANDHQYYLHALDITNNFNDRVTPAQINGADPNGVQFNAECERNRPGLLLKDGVVYIGFATFSCDAGCPNNVPYHGWVFGYNANDLTRKAVYCTSPESGGAGIWQSGNGLVGVGSAIYFETGNGPGPLGDGFGMLSTSSGLQLVHSFQPSDAAQLNQGDTDLGSGGPMFIPPGYIIGGGKQGRYYVLDSGTMALTQDPSPTPPGNFDGFQAFTDTYHNNSGNPPCASLPPAAGCDRWSVTGCYIDVQRYQNGEQCGPNIHAGPVYWSTANPNYGLIYQLAEKDYLKAFHFDKSSHHVDETAFLTSNVRTIEGMPGGFSSLSVNFDHDAILWVSYPLGDGQWNNVPSRLAAFDASNLQQLWSDDGGYLFAKFTPPTIADGKVFRATASGKIVVYGLRTLPWWLRFKQFAYKAFGGKWPPPPPPDPLERAAIEAKFKLGGGKGGLLREPIAEPRPLGDNSGGWVQDFHGLVVGLPASTISVHAPAGLLMPACSQPHAGAGTPFDASIYWSRHTGAHLVAGEIREAWLKLGGHAGRLGFPTSDEGPTADGTGRLSEFEHGKILWSPVKGAEVEGANPERERQPERQRSK
jgi:hypothetical protein